MYNMYTRLQKLCDVNGTTVTALCKQVTGSGGNLSTWKKGYMRSDYLSDVAKILNCSTDYLLGIEQTDTDFTIMPNERKIIENFRELSEQGKEYIEHQIFIAKEIYKKQGVAELAEQII